MYGIHCDLYPKGLPFLFIKSHDIFTNESLTLTWAFQPDDFGFGSQEDPDQDQRKKNVAKIFSMKVTNTIAGGAVVCQSCPEGKTEEGLVNSLTLQMILHRCG